MRNMNTCTCAQLSPSPHKKYTCYSKWSPSPFTAHVLFYFVIIQKPVTAVHRLDSFKIILTALCTVSVRIAWLVNTTQHRGAVVRPIHLAQFGLCQQQKKEITPEAQCLGKVWLIFRAKFILKDAFFYLLSNDTITWRGTNVCNNWRNFIKWILN